MATLKEIRKELKEQGLRKEDIEAAIESGMWLGFLDALVVFPEKPATIIFTPETPPYESHLVCVLPGKDNKEIQYKIYVPGLENDLNITRKERSMFFKKKSWSKPRFLKPPRKELMVWRAAHETRHRVQYECRVKLFSPESAHLVGDEFLKQVIELYAVEFEERKEKYLRENKPEIFIRRQINQKEFDACVIADLVANKTYRRDAYSVREEIAAIIKMSAP